MNLKGRLSIMQMSRRRVSALALSAVALALAGCSSGSDESSSVTGTGANGAGGRGGASGVGGSGISSSGVGGSMAEQIARIGDRVFFPVDRSDLTPEARQLVEKWAEFLRQYPNQNVSIEGHCDERGTREYNLGLGERRANAAKAYLASLGIQASRIDVVSYGKERPAVVGSNEQAWSQNRRAVLVPE
jgi:peptidoglycan-associated lipoprotein